MCWVTSGFSRVGSFLLGTSHGGTYGAGSAPSQGGGAGSSSLNRVWSFSLNRAGSHGGRSGPLFGASPCRVAGGPRKSYPTDIKGVTPDFSTRFLVFYHIPDMIFVDIPPSDRYHCAHWCGAGQGLRERRSLHKEERGGANVPGSVPKGWGVYRMAEVAEGGASPGLGAGAEHDRARTAPTSAPARAVRVAAPSSAVMRRTCCVAGTHSRSNVTNGVNAPCDGTGGTACPLPHGRGSDLGRGSQRSRRIAQCDVGSTVCTAHDLPPGDSLSLTSPSASKGLRGMAGGTVPLGQDRGSRRNYEAGFARREARLRLSDSPVALVRENSRLEGRHIVARMLRLLDGRSLRGRLAPSALLALMVFAGVLFGPEAARGGELRIEPLGAWGGSVDAIYVAQEGDRRIAYIGSGIRLVILDVTDPASIDELGSVMLEGILRDVEVRDGYAFIASTPPAYFSVVDVSDHSNPVVVSTGNTCNHNAPGYDGLAFWGDVVFATQSAGSNPGGFDVSDPTNPVKRCYNIYGCDDLLFVGDVGYLVAMASRIVPELEAAVWTVDMVDHGPLDGYPPILSLGYFTEMFSYWGSLTPIGLYGNYLYLIGHFDSDTSVIYSLLFVIDLSDPEAPAIVGTWGDESGGLLPLGQAMFISDGRLYWAGSGRFDTKSRTMVILDIATDPTAPALLGKYVSDATFTDIFVLGTTAYLGDTREGLTIVDCSNPAIPRRAGNYFSPAAFYRGALDGDHLYVTDFSYGVSILDVSDPRTPRLKGKWETGTYTPNHKRMQNWGIAVRDNQAYLAAGYGGFQVLDVSDPAAPTLAGSFADWPEGVRSVGLALSPDEPIVHLGVIPGAWIVNMDVSDPTNIVDVGAVFIDGFFARPQTIARRPGGIGYVARDGALVTVDLSDPANPLLLGISGPPSYDLAINGDTMFTTNTSYHDGPGCNILDLATVDHLPVPIAYYSYNDPGWLEGTAVTVAGTRAYLGVQTNHEGYTMQVLNVADRTSPVFLQDVPTGTAEVFDLIVDGTTVYAITESVNTMGGGVQVYQVFYGGDGDDDGDVDLQDYAALQRCFSGGAKLPAGGAGANCLVFDFDNDDDVDRTDYALFGGQMSEPR